MTSPYDQIRADVAAAEAADQAKDAQIAAAAQQHQSDRQTIAAQAAQITELENELHPAPTPPPTPQPQPKPALAWGCNVGTDKGQLAAVDKAMGGIGAARFYFGQKAQGVKAACHYPTAAELGGTLGSRILIPSYKLWPQDVLAGMYDADIPAIAHAAPTTSLTIIAAWHEMEDQIESGAFTLAQFLQAQAHVASLLRSAGNPMVKFALILMGYTFNGGKGRDWHNYWQPGVYDYLCTDEYAWTPTYPKDLTTIFANASAAAKEAGVPLLVTETGVNANTFTGQARYDALTAVARRAKAVTTGPSVTYFGSDTLGDVWNLTDPRALAAWSTGQKG